MPYCADCGATEDIQYWRGRWYCHLCKVDEAKKKQIVIQPGIILTVREKDG
jgi:hypothetical protein